jgi:hypothetical protein
MVHDFPGALVGRTGIELLGRLGDDGVQPLSARRLDAGKQRLTYKFMGEGERRLRLLGARDDYSHLLCPLDDGEKPSTSIWLIAVSS